MILTDPGAQRRNASCTRADVSAARLPPSLAQPFDLAPGAQQNYRKERKDETATRAGPRPCENIRKSSQSSQHALKRKKRPTQVKFAKSHYPIHTSPKKDLLLLQRWLSPMTQAVTLRIQRQNHRKTTPRTCRKACNPSSPSAASLASDAQR